MNWARASRSTTLKKKKTNSSLVDSTYNYCKTQQNATLCRQERQGYVQLKVFLLCFVIF